MTSHTSIFGWKDAERSCSHSYLLPEVFKAIDREYGGRKVRILDLGCGNGYVTAQLAARGHEVIGVDVAVDGIAEARAAHPSLRFEVASVYEDGLADDLGGPFDCVVSLEVLEHLFFPAKLFETARNALKPGGYLVLSTPYHGYLKNLAISVLNGWDKHFHVDHDGGHIKFFSERALRRMTERSGLRVLGVSGAGRFPGLWKSMVMRALRLSTQDHPRETIT